ncbi:hypothetical protein SEPCBS57363_002629 [Sporothrix epigloea]|uniref:Nucleotidyl transferase AbiEii toxin, Type IV TA system n=1 Tax=Sporothrix epigloea TaxID=1892477 RepID=A0ABP0DGZ2_9PEZI
MHYGLRTRITEDIDLVVRPTAGVTAESTSAKLLHDFPDAFVAKVVYGVSIPSLIVQRDDGSVKHVEIEMFDVQAWPHRPQYDLDNPDNDVTVIPVSGVGVPVFSARWLLREKIVTALGRKGSKKEETDVDDACALLEIVDAGSVNLGDHPEAVQHFLDRRPDKQSLLQLKVVCPEFLGQRSELDTCM